MYLCIRLFIILSAFNISKKRLFNISFSVLATDSSFLSCIKIIPGSVLVRSSIIELLAISDASLLNAATAFKHILPFLFTAALKPLVSHPRAASPSLYEVALLLRMLASVALTKLSHMELLRNFKLQPQQCFK